MLQKDSTQDQLEKERGKEGKEQELNQWIKNSLEKGGLGPLHYITYRLPHTMGPLFDLLPSYMY